MRSYSYLLNNRRFKARVTAIGTGLLGVLALSVAVASAQLPEKPSQAIPAYAVKRAEAEGLTWVMVDLNVSVSLEDLKTKKKEKEIKDKEQALCAYLNLPTDKKGGFLSNGFGQVQLLLTPGELGRLAKAGSLVKAIHEDTTEDLRRGVSDDDGRLAAIKEKILRYGYAKVRLHRFYSEPEDMDIDLKQFYLLKEADDVRAMYLHGWNPTGTTVDPEALAAARETGYADVLVALRPPLDYTAMIGKTPEAQWAEQAWKLHGLFENVLVSVQFEEISGFPIAHVPHFPLALLKNPPAGIAAIALNRTFSPMLVESEALINMPRAWNIGADGTGQYMVVLDTGVDKTHPFFSNRVVFEACYGTDDLLYTSICPLKDALGDSPVGLAGSGMPKANDHLFYHGTHVAGIAAGKNSTMSGVAPNASIVAVQVFSASKTPGVRPQAYIIDVLTALNLANTVTADNFTINMSLGGGINTAGCNAFPTQAVTFQPVIDGLSSKKIPVIAATGNQAYGGGIAFPACLDKVIKVSAVKDTTGAYEVSYANIDRKADLMGQLLLAPGGVIKSSIPGGAYEDYSAITGLPWQGTSMAAPHVAGLYAAFKEVVPGVSIQEITNWIVANGVQTLVQNSNVPPGEAPLNEYFPRINIPVL